MNTGCPAGCGLTGGCSQCNPSIPSPLIYFPNDPNLKTRPYIGHHNFIPTSPQMGWICSKCGRSYSPVTMECWSCNTLINNGIVNSNTGTGEEE